MDNAVARAEREDTAQGRIVYEQPLTERMRTFLRLDFLYQKTLYHSENESSWETRAAVGSLLEILAILARGDVRGDVLKELERQALLLERYRARAGVDVSRLQALLTNVAEAREQLGMLGGQLVQRLRDSEFLNAIKHRSAIPGGTCEFDMPDYNYWLTRSYNSRAQDLNSWLELIRPLCDGVAELLWLTRESARPHREVAAAGMYQLLLERNSSCQMLRISVPGNSDLYPEISAGQHRCTIRFLKWHSVNSRPGQTTDDVEFLLACCS